MHSILEEIGALREGEPPQIDRSNTNRYRVVALEPNGSRTAYYFSAPMYNSRTRRAVDRRFRLREGVAYVTGSHADITVDDHIRMEDPEGVCTISLSGRPSAVTDTEMVCGRERLRPTTNGIAIRHDCTAGDAATFSVTVSRPFPEIRANDKCFALMCEHFRPFMSLSCIGTADADGNILAPATLSYEKMTDCTYIVTVAPCSSRGTSVLLEANLYEPKLFQDTTVESRHAGMNNAFGGTAFLGHTKEFGEQWLYARPDYTKMPELNDRQILRAVLHLPKLNRDATELCMSGVAARFCSFGSTWENKIAEMPVSGTVRLTERYIDLDMTSLLADRYGQLSKGDGFILKAKRKGPGFSAVTTGDSCLFPQILELNYR